MNFFNIYSIPKKMFKRFFLIAPAIIFLSCNKEKKNNSNKDGNKNNLNKNSKRGLIEPNNGILEKQNHKTATLNLKGNIFSTEILRAQNIFSKNKCENDRRSETKKIIQAMLIKRSLQILFDTIVKNSFNNLQTRAQLSQISNFNVSEEKLKSLKIKLEFNEEQVDRCYNQFIQFIAKEKEENFKIEIENLFQQLKEAYFFIKSEQNENKKYLCT